MGNTGRVIGKILVSILLIAFLIGFVSVLSISQNVNESNVEDIFVEVSEETIQEKIDEYSEGVNEEDLDSIYTELIVACENDDFVDFGGVISELDCTIIEAAGPEGVEEVLKQRFDEEVKSDIQSQIGDAGVYEYISLFNIITWAFLIVSLILIFLLFVMSVPKHTFLISLGIVFLISGLPFIFASASDYTSEVPQISALQNIVSGLTHKIFLNFMIVFVLGVVMMIVGIIWKMTLKKGKDKEKKKA